MGVGAVPACVTINVYPAMSIAPVREAPPVLAATARLTDPLPAPLAPEVYSDPARSESLLLGGVAPLETSVCRDCAVPAHSAGSCQCSELVELLPLLPEPSFRQ
jgi:hypothetical protein